jgi:hypothetical protein
VPHSPSMGALLLHITRAFGKSTLQQQLSQSVHSTHIHTFDLNPERDKAFKKFTGKYLTIGNHIHINLEKLTKALGEAAEAAKSLDHSAVRGRYLPPPHSMAHANSQQYIRKGRRK